MKDSQNFDSFADLKDALAEVRKNNPPAETRYQQQAKHMGYTKDPKTVQKPIVSESKKKKFDEPLKGFPGNEDVNEDEIARAKEVISLQKKHEREKQIEKDKLDKEKEKAKQAADRAKAQQQNEMSEASAFDGMTKIVNDKQAQKVGGIMIDMFTASVILKAYTKVNASNKEKMRKANVQTLVNLAQKIMGMKEELGLDEGGMSDMLIDIQQGATAKELSKTWKIPMSMAKDFLKSYYGQKKGSRKEQVNEGTWAIPSTIDKMKKFQRLLQKPMEAKNKAAVEKFKDSIYSLIGDDELFDVYDKIIMDKEFNGQEMVGLLVKSLEGRWFNFKKKGRGWVATHQYFPMEQEDEEVEEGKGRPSGYYKPKKKQVVSEIKESFITNSPFKLKSKQYPRALAIETKGYGKRHASQEDIVEACDSFGMITEQELQIQQIEKTLGKRGFLTYNTAILADIFEERETERMILALESVTGEVGETEYDRATITRALEEELNVEFVKPDGMKAVGPVLKMSNNTYNLKDMHTGKSFTYKYIDEDKNMKSFSEVISEARFPKKLVRMAGGIAFDKRYVGGDMSGAIKAIEKLKKGLSDDPSVKDMLKLANESFNNEFYKAMSEEEKTAYQKFFQSALKKFGVQSPAELDGDKKKEFFNYVDKNWKGDGEKKESVEEGKYTEYSDLLLMKARIIAKEGPKSDKLPAVNSQIKIVMKRLGVKEDGTTKVDGRIRPFKEKMTKLGYFKR